MSLITQSGETIEGDSAHLADPDTVVISTQDGDRSVSVAEIANVLTHLQSPGPE